MNLDFGSLLINGEDVSDIARYIPMVNHVHISEKGLEGIKHRKEHSIFIHALKEAGYGRYVSIEMRNQEDPEKVLSIVDYVRGLLNE
jgi:sugar phosphate isomerase/epimerase